MKKMLMIAAALTMGSAGLAQSNMGTADQSWNTASGGYPACSRTVTDSCIQLYERGVRSSANLALNRNRGMSAGGVGGPYEAVTAHSGTMTTTHGTYAGTGGPIDQRTGYPPCTRRGPGQDSCIQLYERGVTGAGN
ncbi:MAG TPA: hypothetical protein VNT77_04065 [Allosphingosinicella sp.]|nr:hypothetical protein [Allosphingosinicella sp.]